MKGFNPNSNKGFSIIELMIVVAIIGVLAAVAAPSYLRHVYRTRQAEGVHRLLDIKTAQEKFYAINDLYFTTNDLSAEAGTEFEGYLNFAVDEAGRLHEFAITSTDATENFTAEAYSDLNADAGNTHEMCWAITESTTNPVRIASGDTAVALGDNCSTAANAEELSFSTLFF